MKYDSRKDTLAHKMEVISNLQQVAHGLDDRGLVHDNSKLVGEEKRVFDTITPKLKKLSYGSEAYKKSLESMGKALDNHYKENRHHPEHHDNGIKDMTLLDLIEMLSDWKAACMRHDDGDIKKSLEINKERFNISDDIYKMLINTCKELDWFND